MRRALPFFFIVLCWVAVGCGKKDASVPRRNKYYRKVISLSPSTTEIVSSDGDVQTLRGRTAADNFPQNVVAGIRIVAAVKPDYETIAAIHPDLIVYDKSLYTAQDIEKLKAPGTDFFAIDAETVDSFIKELYELGAMLGWETRFNDYINRIQMEKEGVAKYSPVPKVAIIIPSADGSDMICGADGFLGDVVKIAGGQIVGPKGTLFVPLNPEALVALNPDVILASGTKADLSGIVALQKDPRFKTISAVKNNRVMGIDADVLLRRGQRVDQLLKSVHLEIGPPSQ